MNAIVLKWLSMSLIGTVVISALWLAGSVRGNAYQIPHDAAAPVSVTVVAQAR